MRKNNKNNRRERLKWILGSVLIFVALIVFLAWAAPDRLAAGVDVSILKNHYPKVKFDPKTKTRKVQVLASPPPTWVSLGSLQKSTTMAILVSEDWAFFEHGGIDVQQIKKAFEATVDKGRKLRGASTITQQVAKNVFLDFDRSYIRKLRELAIALAMERELSKKRILEIYLNIAEWGPGVYGIGQAAHYYFDKPAQFLRPKEAAFLALLLPSPIKYAESFRIKKLSDFAKSRIEDILGKLHKIKVIDDEDIYEADLTPLSFENIEMFEGTEAFENTEDDLEPGFEPEPPPEGYGDYEDSGTEEIHE